MSTPPRFDARSARRTFRLYLGVLLGISLVLGVLHLNFSDLKAGGVYWFDLDQERNVPTWFSGLLFFLFGASAIVTWYYEGKRNAEGPACFRLPVLWLGVGLAGLVMSLDEITILHENLFWREIRVASNKLGGPWRYVTQWQILFLPAILLGVGYFVVFFSHRFRASRGARWGSFAGIGCWMGALFLEGIRETFRQAGEWGYSRQVFLEEELEMAGSLFFLAAIVFYTIDIALDFTPGRRARLTPAPRLLSRRAVAALTVAVMSLFASAGTVFLFAHRQAARGAPIPGLFERALGPRAPAGPEGTGGGGGDPAHSVPEVWFDDVQKPVALTGAEERALTRFVAASLLDRSGPGGDFPKRLVGDPYSRIVFLSVSDGRTPARVAIGTARGIRQAVEQALTRTGSWRRSGHRIEWAKLDIVQAVEPIDRFDRLEPLEWEGGVDGIAFDRGSGIAFLPGEVLAHALVDGEKRIRPGNIAGYLGRRSTVLRSRFESRNRSRNLHGYRFTTRSFFLDGSEAVSLYRGHRRFGEINREEILAAARRGGDYLVRAVDPAGRFVYSYLPREDEVAEQYNFLRHAGTVHAMLELYEVTGEPDLLRAAQRAVDHLLSAIRPCHLGGETHACLVEDGYVKLGGNALAAIALAKYAELTGDRRRRNLLVPLARWIQAAQNERGEFFIHKRSHPGGAVDRFVSDYYPGEALLALVRVYRLEPDESLLDTAERGARFLIRERDGGRSIPELTHDHWLLYALNELYRHRPEPLYLDHAGRIAVAILQSQNRDPEFPDWFGSYNRPPRSTPTAVRTEGLCAAYQLARDAGRGEEADRILEAIRFGVGFQLQTQFGPESVMYLSDPQRSLGGFHRSLTDFEIRIDYVQHNISALLGLYRILDGLEDPPTGTGPDGAGPAAPRITGRRKTLR